MGKYKRPPRVKIISNKAFQKETGLKRGGYTKGNTIYATKDAGDFVIEHEKAHVKFGHQVARLTPPQFIKRELKADRYAVDRTGFKYRKKDLEDIAKDTANRFGEVGVTKKEASEIIMKEARKFKLIK